MRPICMRALSPSRLLKATKCVNERAPEATGRGWQILFIPPLGGNCLTYLRKAGPSVKHAARARVRRRWGLNGHPGRGIQLPGIPVFGE